MGDLLCQVLAPFRFPLPVHVRVHPADVLPHYVQYGCANQTVLNRAREQERAGVLHQRPDDVGPTALVDVVRSRVEAVPNLRRRNNRRRRLRRRSCRRRRRCPRFENCVKIYNMYF